MLKRKIPMKAKKKTKQRERKSDCLVNACSTYSKRPKLASIALDRRLNSMVSGCRARDKKLGKETHITIGMLRELAKKVIGTNCIYCNTEITHLNISLDHIIPLSRGGNTCIENVQLICNTCNKQKDKLFHKEFQMLKELIETFTDESKKYVNTKLSMQGGWNGYYKSKEKTETNINT